MMIKGDNISYANIYKFDDGTDGDISLYVKDTSGNNYTIAFSIYPDRYYVRLLINNTETWRISK